MHTIVARHLMDFSHGLWVQTANKSIYYIYKCEQYCMWCNSNCLLSYVVQYDMYVVPFDCHAPNSIVKLSFRWKFNPQKGWLWLSVIALEGYSHHHGNAGHSSRQQIVIQYPIPGSNIAR